MHPSSFEMPELEHKILRRSRSWRVNAANAISDISFMPGNDDRLLLTASRGIGCEISCWDMYPDGPGLDAEPRKICDWEPKATVFLGFAVNSDPTSPVQLAVGITRNDIGRIELLSLSQPLTSADPQFRLRKILSCGFRPITLQGDLLAVSDDYVQTKIYNWHTGAEALLKSSKSASGSTWEWNRCLQVLFTKRSVIIIRARSVELFPQPELLDHKKGTSVYRPIARHSFGWPDGITASAIVAPSQDLRIMLRSTIQDAAKPTLNLYNLEIQLPGDENTPVYKFPPALNMQLPLAGGAIRCTDLVLRPHGTAVWITPRQVSSNGSVQMDIHEHPVLPSPEIEDGECLTMGVFNATACEGRVKHLFWNPKNNWSSLDYNEELGRVVLGSSDGMVTLLEL